MSSILKSSFLHLGEQKSVHQRINKLEGKFVARFFFHENLALHFFLPVVGSSYIRETFCSISMYMPPIYVNISQNVHWILFF